MDQTVLSYFNQFGLSEDEALIYLKLLELGPATVQQLASACDLKRSTTHIKVEDLIQKGLVTQTKRGARRMVVAEVPEKLQSLLDQKKWELKRLENNLPDIIEGIYKNVPKVKDTTDVEVKYYESRNSVKHVYHEILKAKKIYSFANLLQVRKVLPENTGLFERALKQNKELEIWEILDHRSSSLSPIKNERYHYCFIPSSKFQFSNDFIIFDNYVALVSLQAKPSAILIDSKTIAEGLRTIHQVFWEFLKPSK